jgi:hypothetical protein
LIFIAVGAGQLALWYHHSLQFWSNVQHYVFDVMLHGILNTLIICLDPRGSLWQVFGAPVSCSWGRGFKTGSSSSRVLFSEITGDWRLSYWVKCSEHCSWQAAHILLREIEHYGETDPLQWNRPSVPLTFFLCDHLKAKACEVCCSLKIICWSFLDSL